MNYSKEYKEQVFTAYKNLEFVNDLTKAMDNNQSMMVRSYLELGLDDSDIVISEEIKDEGERLIANAKIKTKQLRQECYNWFMEAWCKENNIPEEVVMEVSK